MKARYGDGGGMLAGAETSTAAAEGVINKQDIALGTLLGIVIGCCSNACTPTRPPAAPAASTEHTETAL
jgi:hypothetical protein